MRNVTHYFFYMEICGHSNAKPAPGTKPLWKDYRKKPVCALCLAKRPPPQQGPNSNQNKAHLASRKVLSLVAGFDFDDISTIILDKLGRPTLKAHSGC